ncbi:MAG: hypothetical protein MZV63_14140 [Marinilabiliales bacterium]|nr:hypothetical protein [Marinilabiliales bacterium]
MGGVMNRSYHGARPHVICCRTWCGGPAQPTSTTGHGVPPPRGRRPAASAPTGGPRGAPAAPPAARRCRGRGAGRSRRGPPAAPRRCSFSTMRMASSTPLAAQVEGVVDRAQHRVIGVGDGRGLAPGRRRRGRRCGRRCRRRRRRPAALAALHPRRPARRPWRRRRAGSAGRRRRPACATPPPARRPAPARAARRPSPRRRGAAPARGRRRPDPPVARAGLLASRPAGPRPRSPARPPRWRAPPAPPAPASTRGAAACVPRPRSSRALRRAATASVWPRARRSCSRPASDCARASASSTAARRRCRSRCAPALVQLELPLLLRQAAQRVLEPGLAAAQERLGARHDLGVEAHAPRQIERARAARHAQQQAEGRPERLEVEADAGVDEAGVRAGSAFRRS